MPGETTKWDVAEYLDSPEMITEYISEALETGDPEFVKTALGDIARARGMTQISKDSGVTREALYRALNAKGDPRMSTLFGVLKALGVKLSASPV
jgi:probable addiction module antidote protein